VLNCRRLCRNIALHSVTVVCNTELATTRFVKEKNICNSVLLLDIAVVVLTYKERNTEK
jgi:hypothetical protein